MTDDLQRALDENARKIAGPTPIEKQIILAKLIDLYKNQPENLVEYAVPASSPQREWLSAVSALINRHDDTYHVVRFRTKMQLINVQGSVYDIIGIVSDVIADIQLDLELDGRSDIGTMYQPGEVYQFYADLKDIISGAKQEIFLIDPYLDGQAFDDYLGATRNIRLRLLVGKGKTSREAKKYADRHAQQYGTSVEVRRSSDLHDRLIIQDNGDAWVIGGSLNMKGGKATYLLPLTPGVADVTRNLYANIWGSARQMPDTSERE